MHRINWSFKISAWTILLAVILVIWLLRPFSCPSQPNNSKPTKYTDLVEKLRTMTVSDTITVIDTVFTAAEASGYWLPDTVYVPGDSLRVETVVVTSTDTVFIATTIDSIPVLYDTLTFIPPELPVRRVQGFAEYNDTQTFAVGVAYRLAEWQGVQVSPAIGSNGEYLFAEIRLSRKVWSGVSCGVGVGYRILVDEGLHYSVGVSIEL